MASPKKRLSFLSSTKTGAANVMLPRMLLILSAFALLVFGLVMVYSASFVWAFTNDAIGNDSMHYFKRQLLSVGVGLVAMLLATAISYRVWNTIASWLPWTAISVLLIMTFIAGNEELGGQRWIDVFGFNFQPSEFAKITIVLVGAALVIKLYKGEQVKNIVLLAALAIGLPVLFILLQPDLGTVIIIAAGVIAVAWFGELPLRTLAIVILCAVFLGAAMILLAGFRMNRIDAWLDPWALASNEGYQIVNSFYAFAGGGVSGVGLGLSHQKYLYLPQPQNDLIFPIIGEEFGLIGTVLVVLLFLLFLYAGFRIARNAPDFHGRIIAGSAATLIGFQAFLNMFCMTNLLPLTGKPLPFFSAGGSSIVTTLILVGLILNVSFRSRTPEAALKRASKRRDELLIIEGGRGVSGKGKKAEKAGTAEKLGKLGKEPAYAGGLAGSLGRSPYSAGLQSQKQTRFEDNGKSRGSMPSDRISYDRDNIGLEELRATAVKGKVQYRKPGLRQNGAGFDETRAVATSRAATPERATVTTRAATPARATAATRAATPARATATTHTATPARTAATSRAATPERATVTTRTTTSERVATSVPQLRTTNHANPALKLSPARNPGLSTTYNIKRRSLVHEAPKRSMASGVQEQDFSPSTRGGNQAYRTQNYDFSFSTQNRDFSPGTTRSRYL